MLSRKIANIGISFFTCFILLPCCENNNSLTSSPNLTLHQKDSIVMRNILDLNGLTKTKVWDVASPDTGRITAITAQYQEVDTIPEEISQLNALKFIHLAYTSLKTIPSAIGNINTLQYLNLSHSKINSLPSNIINLSLPNLGQSYQIYTGLFVEYNNICNVPNEIKTWLTTYDSSWQLSQICN